MGTTSTNGFLIRTAEPGRDKLLGCLSQKILTVRAQVTLHGSIMVIEVPQKLWIPKVVNKYIPPDYADDIDEGIFDLAQYGISVYKPRTNWV